MNSTKKKRNYEVVGQTTENVNSDIIKKSKRTIIFESSMLHNVKIVVHGSLVTMTGEMKERNLNLLSRQIDDEKCETVLSNDGKHVEINCSTLEDNELRLGVTKTTFTQKQIDLLAVCFIRCSNWPFKELAVKVSKSPSLKNENITKICKWFYNTYRTFKAGKYPGWAVDPSTRKPYYRCQINELDGKMRLFAIDSDEDTDIRRRKSNLIRPKVIINEAVCKSKRKLLSESHSEEIKDCGVKCSSEYTNPNIANIKQEVVDYEVQHEEFSRNCKKPHQSPSISFRQNDTEYPYGKYIKSEHLLNPGENESFINSSRFSDASKTMNEVKRSTNSKNRPVDHSIHQKLPEPTQHKLSSKNKRKTHGKAISASSVVPSNKIAELRLGL